MAKKKPVKPKNPPVTSDTPKVVDQRGESDDLDTAPTFEVAMGEVKEIVEQLESGKLDLTASLESYELGIRRLKQCHQFLDVAEQKVTLLSGFDGEGNPVTEPMPETVFRSAGASAAPPVKAKKKRASRKAADSKVDSDATEDSAFDDGVDDSPGLF